eukprot:CAMPEP_0198221596 /NCGR_PEP_ID=MMETSP1445-20131203/84338_1 /TAXON_ID=36898 /ORGANISM="Pyramimonas sp., Strain CCMP2087" /LENGTH=353 /DNA_ID=CAMNT_0043899801 /DNA_START=233 /DNA_END=1294 /DNA_ORIENTATION=+
MASHMGLSLSWKKEDIWSGRYEDLKDAVESLPPFQSYDDSKGSSGKIGVVGGCLEYTGAPYFAAMSAMRVGADLAHVFCALSAGPVIKALSPELIVHPYLPEAANMKAKDAVTTLEAADMVEAWFSRLDVLVVGPGLGRDPFVLATVTEIIARARKAGLPLIIDADGLYIVNQNLKLIKGYTSCILTPNANEFVRLQRAVNLCRGYAGADINEVGTPAETVQAMSAHLEGVTIVRKGKRDLVVNSGCTPLVVDWEGCPRRVGGQGDILAGTVAVFWAWTRAAVKAGRVPLLRTPDMQPAISAYAACAVVRRAQMYAFEKHRRAMGAGDVIAELGPVMQEVFPLYLPQELIEEE